MFSEKLLTTCETLFRYFMFPLTHSLMHATNCLEKCWLFHWKSASA